MKFDEIRSHVDGIPYTQPEWGELLYNFIVDNKPAECLELGFAHGVSSCYMAAALDELGTGHLTAVDLLDAADWQKPSIEDLLLRTGLQKYVTVVRERTSYNWFLKKKIEENSPSNGCEPIYDFCFIDGPKNWNIDGFAFFLVDKLLKQNGWILFDDLKWTYGSKGKDQTDGISHRKMGEDELNTPHIELIYRLLVLQHPDYSEFRIQGDWWAWAQKLRAPLKTLTYTEVYTPRTRIFRVLRKLAELTKKRLGPV
jgi:predicted O-methyltransferase YrrM